MKTDVAVPLLESNVAATRPRVGTAAAGILGNSESKVE